MIDHSRRRRRRHALIAVLAGTALALAGCSASPASDDAPGGSAGGSSATTSSLTIGVFESAQAALVDSIVDTFETTIKKDLGPTVDVTFDLKNANGDQSLITSIARDFAGSGDDAFAVAGSDAIVALSGQVKDRPIFGIDMADPVTLGLAKSLDAPGGNLTGSVAYVDPGQLLDKVLEIQPGITTLGTIYNPSAQNMKEWIVDLRAAMGDAGLKLVEATISGAGDVTQAARSLNGRVDAVLLGPDADVLSSFDAVASAATAGKLPLYTNGGDPSVAGVLAGIGPDYTQTAQAAADVAAKVLQGADAATTAFAQTTVLDVTVNSATADQLGLTVPQDVLDSATVL